MIGNQIMVMVCLLETVAYFTTCSLLTRIAGYVIICKIMTIFVISKIFRVKKSGIWC